MFYYINVRCYHYYDDPITIVFYVLFSALCFFINISFRAVVSVL